MQSDRLDFLMSNDLLIDFAEAVAQPPKYIVTTGFGFGVEYWAVDDPSYEYDEPRYASKYIRGGKCIIFTESTDPKRQIERCVSSTLLYESID